MKHNLLTKLTIITILTILTNLVYAADKGNDPVAHWRFNEGGGPTAYDESSNNLDGTLTGTEGDEWTTGKTGSAISLDNGDDRVAISDPGTGSVIDFTTAVTLEAWVYRTDTPSSQARIVGKGDYYLLYTQGSNNKVNFYGSALSPNQLTANTALPLNEWAHVAATFGSGARKIYINGKLDNSDTPTGSFGVDDGELTIGNYRTPAESYRFRGKIDDVKVYDYARTAAQILVDYNAGSAAHLGDGADPNEGNTPVAYLKLDENTGTNAYDRSGNDNNGSITGAGWVHGKHGSALSFNGSSDLVTVSNLAGDTFYQAGTISFWLYLDRWTNNDNAFGTATNNTNALRLERDASANKGRFIFGNSGGTYGSLYSNKALSVGVWQYISLTWDQPTTSATVYVNGQYDNTTSSLTTFPSTFPFFKIGAGYSGRFIDGKVDEFKIYDYARTDAQVAYDYNKGAPIAHYKFDEGTGTIAHNEYSTAGSGAAAPVALYRMDNDWTDASGNGNTGTATLATFSTSPKIGTHCGLFDADVDYVDIGTLGQSAAMANGTIELWINPTATYNSSLTENVNMFGRANVRPRIYIDPDGKIRWSIYSGSGTNEVLSLTASWTGGTWYHVTVTWGSNGQRLYINGVQEAADTSYTNTYEYSATSWRFPRRHDGYADFEGKMDDVRIYDYARTAEQIYNDYKSTHGTMVADTKFVDGKIGKALEFDGTGDYVDTGITTDFSGTGDFTVSAWFKGSNSVYMITQTHTAGSYASDWIFGGSGTELFWMRSQNLGTASTIEDGNWHHVAMVWDKSAETYEGFVDGASIGTSSTVSDYGGVNSVKIGTRGDATTTFTNGSVDDVRIHNYARTAAQVIQDYNAGTAFHPGGGTGEKDPWSGDLPVGHWKMDENTGILARDASENANDGTLGGDGAGTDVPAWTQGKHGSGLQFTDDHVKFLDSNNLDTGDYFTFEGWYNFSDLGFRSDIYFYNRNGQSGTSAFHIIWLNGASTIGYQYANGTSVVSKYSSSLSWSTGQWYHIAVTHDNVAKEIKYYRDGVYINTATYADNALNVTAGNAYLGGYQGDTRFRGKIDDVKLYNYVRTQAQIAWDYNKGKPVAHYRFNESSGTDAWDETTNNNATITIGGTGSQTTIAAAHTNSATGKFGRCMSFDGSDDYATASSATAFDSTEWSVTAWVKIGTGDYQTLVSFNNGDLPRAQLSHGTYPLLYLNSGGDDYYRYGNLDIKDNKWHHVAFLFRDSDNYVKIFVDGIDRTGSGPNGNEASVTSTWRISDSSYTVNGLVDDVRVYNYVRTAEQLLLDYNAGAALRLGD